MARVFTLTLNPAIDQTVRLDHLVPGAVHRAHGQQSEAGGKGIGVAAVLAALGVSVTAAGWLGAENPALFEAAFAANGIRDGMLRLPGATRTNIKLADAQRGDSTDINLPGITLSDEARARAEADLLASVLTQIQPGDWCELAGSLPPGVDTGTWCRLADALTACGAQLMVDIGGAELGELLQHLRRPPAFLKPNRAELEALMGRPLDTVEAVAAAADELRRQGVPHVVVSLGGEGAVIVGDGGQWLALPPKVPVATTVGAGDALVAGTIAALMDGRTFPDAAVFGMACAAARIQRIAPGLPPRDHIDALAAQVQLRSL